ncbi:cytochrome c oxidase accessory protein CcoG [soil metagenome]
MTASLQPTLLSTLNSDGTRKVPHPKLARGRFLTRRRVVGYSLIALFVLLPRIRIGGRPAFLIDLVTREVSAFGSVFRPTDGFLLALLGLTIVAIVFFVTALFGRVWCGWGCPQTVYLELVFRPIERWLEGSRRQRTNLWRRGVKLVIFAALSFALSNVFLAYFVGTDRLEQWVFESPLQHVGGFTLVMAVSALILFDFGYFREQMCIVACPYGRLQSVLLDRQSLIVGYDAKRGEPRARLRKSLPVLAAGACVDCHACVAVCPTGIDIRDGLQMECVGCTQCIDACDKVMDKLARPRGLIRYTSQDELAGLPRKLLRVRTIVYPVMLALAFFGLVWTTGTRSDTEVSVDRISGPAFVELPDGKVSAQLHLKVENRAEHHRTYRFELVPMEGGTLRAPLPQWEADAHHAFDVPLFVDLPRTAFVHGEAHAKIRVTHDAGFSRIVEVTLLGPEAGAR